MHDFLSLVPLELLALPSAYHAGLRFNRLFRVLRWAGFESKFESRTNYPNLFRLLFLLHRLLLVVHIDACFYFLISKHEGFGINVWVLPAAVASKETCAGCVVPFVSTTVGQYLACMYLASASLMVGRV